MSFPNVEKISVIMDVLRDYAVKSARLYCKENQSGVYTAPSLAAWNAGIWYELLKDWKLVDFLASGTSEAELLIRSLQSYVQWYGQSEIAEIRGRFRLMGMSN